MDRLLAFGAKLATAGSCGVSLQEFGSNDRKIEARWKHDGKNAFAEAMQHRIRLRFRLCILKNVALQWQP
jgi:hypothetical protein